jgi:hypothetical protein
MPARAVVAASHAPVSNLLMLLLLLLLPPRCPAEDSNLNGL